MLGLARATVVRSYDDLEGQGFIETVSGKGTFVSRRLPAHVLQSKLPDFPAGAVNLEPPTALLSEYAQTLIRVPFVRSTSADRPELNYGSAPLDQLPLRQWRELLIAHSRSASADTYSYVTEPFGHRPLREAIAYYLARSKAVRCSPEQVIIFPGSQHPLYHVAQILLDKGDRVVIENPGYVGARENFMARGAQMFPIDVDENGIRVEDLKRSDITCKFVYVAPTYHDPTGAAMSLERRKQLLEWAQHKGSLVVEDAFDSDYRYFGQPLPSLQSLDENGNVLYIYSMWKTLYPLSAVGVLVVPHRLISLFERVKLLAERQLPALEHLALTDFITEGHLERHMKRVRAVYAKRRQTLIHVLSLQFRSSVKVPKQSAALHLMLRLKCDLPAEQIMARARVANLPLVSTELYYAENPRPDEFLVAFASLNDDEIEGNVAAWARSLGYTGND